MNKTQILEFTNTNPVCRLATVEGDQPRVRGMMMYKADDEGIIFHTGISRIYTNNCLRIQGRNMFQQF